MTKHVGRYVAGKTNLLQILLNDPSNRLWSKRVASAVKQDSSFTDVPASADYVQAVAWAVENGVTSGTDNGQFSPDNTCTRGQIVTFLYRAMGK